MSYRKLLRWYPEAWRQANGDVFLGMLEDDATARGATKPTFAEAWSIRVHGLAERASYKVALVLAVVSLLSLTGPAAVSLTDRLSSGETFISISPAFLAAVLLGRLTGVAAFGLTVVSLLVGAKRMSAWPAASAAAVFVLSALTGSLDFAVYLFPMGLSQGELPFPLGAAWPTSTALFMLAALICFVWSFPDSRPSWLRLLLGGPLGVLAGVLYSKVMLEGSGIGSLTAGALLVVAIVAATRERADASVSRSRGAQLDDGERALDARPSSRVLGALVGTGVASAVLGGICFTIHQQNLTWAEPWTSANLAAAALAPLPTVIAAGALLRGRIGGLAIWASTSWVLALGLVAACWSLRPLMEGILFAIVPALAAALAVFGTILCLTGSSAGSAMRALPAAAALAIVGGSLLSVSFLQIIAIAPLLCFGAAVWAFRLLRAPSSERSRLSHPAAS